MHEDVALDDSIQVMIGKKFQILRFFGRGEIKSCKNKINFAYLNDIK